MKKLFSLSKANRNIFSQMSESFVEAVFLLRVYYFFTFISFLGFLYNWKAYATKPQFVSSWLADWIWKVGHQEELITAVMIALLASSFIAALNPFSRFIRWIHFLSVQVMVSYYIAVSGYANNGYYGFSLILFGLLILPSHQDFAKHRRLAMHRTLTSLWLSAGSLVVIYFLIGLGNVHGAIVQHLAGQTSLLSPKSLAYFILYEIQTSGRETALSNFVIQNYFPFWLGIFLILIEKLISPFVWIYRPSWMPVLGVGLILFHTLNSFMFGLPFEHLVFQVALFFILSPMRLIRAKLGTRRRWKKYFFA